MDYRRFALYYVPPADAGWARFATRWLGWDMVAGRGVDHPAGIALDLAAITAVPRRYGLHATLKPPFRLAAGRDRAGLEAACETLAAGLAPARAEGLDLAPLGRFLALRPVGDAAALNALAAAWVTGLDDFRAPPEAAETARRNQTDLTAAQAANLARWGYPFVLGEFRFHITLTGRLDPALLAQVRAVLAQHLLPQLPAPFVVADVALAGEGPDGRFRLLRRFPLTG